MTLDKYKSMISRQAGGQQGFIQAVLESALGKNIFFLKKCFIYLLDCTSIISMQLAVDFWYEL